MHPDIAILVNKQESVSAEWRDKLHGVEQRQYTYSSPLGNIIHYTLQCNTERVRSTMAKTNATPTPVKCRICAENRPSDQLFIEWIAQPSGNVFDILINPFPIFPAHLTVVSKSHRPQHIDAQDIQDFAFYSKMAVFFNGADCGASIPGHMHYQAAPIECFNIVEDAKKCSLGENLTDCASYIQGLERNVILMTTNRSDNAMEKFNALMQQIHRTDDRMINVLVYWNQSQEQFLWFIFPRQKFRPDRFFAENEEQRLLISPATAELCGVIVTPDINTFNRITVDDIHTIISQS